jgi:hypothetical protein
LVLFALAALLAAASPAAAQTCSADDSCPYKCARVYQNGASYCDACCTAATALDPEETAPLVFYDRPRLAAIRPHSVSIFEVPAGSSVTVDGRNADGAMALAGALSMPDVTPARVLTFSEPIARARRPQRNGPRFLVCTDSRGPKRPAKRKDSRTRFCGVLDVKGEPVYAAPAPARDGWVEALALSADGAEAAFEYGRRKAVDTYLLWNESTGSKRYKADPKDLTLRRALDRLGIHEDSPE